MELAKIIRDAKLIFENGDEFDIQCGSIENKEGVFFIDSFYKNDSDIWKYFTHKDKSYIYNRYTIKGHDEELHEIEITDLKVRSVSYYEYYIHFYCKGYIRHNDKSGTIKTSYSIDKDGKKSKPKIIDNSVLYYLELENLKIDFDTLADKTLHLQAFYPKKNISLKEIWISETTFEITVKEYLTKRIKITFRQSDINDNIIVSFDKILKNDKLLKEREYQRFKDDFISFLSFLNGGRVNLRREFVGSSSISGKIHSSEIVTYSFKTRENTGKNNYIPLQYSHTSKILQYSFKCFNTFVEKNKIFDFTSIIFILNGNNDTSNLDNRFFSLITAFERISHKYALFDEVKKQHIIPDNIYGKFKKDFILTLDKNKSKFHKSHPNAYSALKSKLTELNIRKRTDTKSKFYHILERLKIQVTPEIDSIIQNIRDTSVHQGDFGKGKDAYKNYFVLDKLIRDIILKLIDYEGALNESEYYL